MTVPNHPHHTSPREQSFFKKEGPIRSPFADDPIFHPLVEAFVKKLPHEICQLSQALKANDIRTLCFLSHRLKGTTATYGYPEIAKLLGMVESLASQNSFTNQSLHLTALLIKKIEQFLPQIEAGLSLSISPNTY